MESTRRDFLILGGKMFVMTSVAASAFEHVLAGAPEKPPPATTRPITGGR